MAQQTLNTPREATHQRIAAALEAIEQNMSDEHEAVNIDYDNTYSDLSADNVQEAIDELSSEKANTADLGTAASKDVPTSGNATSTQVVMGNDTRLTDARPASDVSSWAKAPTKPTYTASEVGTYTSTEIDNKYVAKETGKGLSTNDYTIADKNKLAGIEAEANKTVVDSAMSDSSTNPLQNKVITKELEGAKTATGNPITVTDAAPVNAVNLSMDLEPIQDLHGYDHPWVGGAGKNKLPMTVDGIKSANTSGTWNGNVYTLNGVTFTIQTDNDGNVTGIKANGTASAALDFYFAKGSITVPDNAVFSTNVTKVTGFDEYIGSIGITSGYNYVSLPSGIYTNCGLYLTSGYNAQNLIFYPMIRLATETDSSFAPYTNICPISGRSEVAIERVGKNLCKLIDGITYGKAINNGVVVDSVSGTWISELMPISDFDTLYIKVFEKSSYTNGSVVFHESVDGVNYTQIDSISNTSSISDGYSNSYAISSSAKYLRISGYMAGNTASTKYIESMKLMLALSPITTYQPYAGKTYTIQIGDTVYGAQFDVTRGKMVVDKGYATVDEDSEILSGGSMFVATNTLIGAKAPISQSQLTGVLCNSLREVAQASTWGVQGTFSRSRQSITSIYFKITNDITTVEQVKTYLTSNPLQFVYELATPITIPLTPQQIKMLENTNTIYTDYEGDTITIEYQPNNAIGEAVRAVEESYDAIIQNLLERIEALENNE